MTKKVVTKRELKGLEQKGFKVVKKKSPPAPQTEPDFVKAESGRAEAILADLANQMKEFIRAAGKDTANGSRPTEWDVTPLRNEDGIIKNIRIKVVK